MEPSSRAPRRRSSRRRAICAGRIAARAARRLSSTERNTGMRTDRSFPTTTLLPAKRHGQHHFQHAAEPPRGTRAATVAPRQPARALVRRPTHVANVRPRGGLQKSHFHGYFMVPLCKGGGRMSFITVDRGLAAPLTRQIYERLRALILPGGLPPGPAWSPRAVLPGSCACRGTSSWTHSTSSWRRATSKRASAPGPSWRGARLQSPEPARAFRPSARWVSALSYRPRGLPLGPAGPHAVSRGHLAAAQPRGVGLAHAPGPLLQPAGGQARAA